MPMALILLPRFRAMLDRAGSSDMVVGARVGSHSGDPFARRPAKWALRKFAGLLAGQTIPDLNSGMRVHSQIAG